MDVRLGGAGKIASLDRFDALLRGFLGTSTALSSDALHHETNHTSASHGSDTSLGLAHSRSHAGGHVHTASRW